LWILPALSSQHTALRPALSSQHTALRPAFWSLDMTMYLAFSANISTPNSFLATTKPSMFFSRVCRFYCLCGIAQSIQQLAMGWTVRESNPGDGDIFITLPLFPGLRRPGRSLYLPPHLTPRLKKGLSYNFIFVPFIYALTYKLMSSA
jgi:hypothetical protein